MPTSLEATHHHSLSCCSYTGLILVCLWAYQALSHLQNCFKGLIFCLNFSFSMSLLEFSSLFKGHLLLGDAFSQALCLSCSGRGGSESERQGDKRGGIKGQVITVRNEASVPLKTHWDTIEEALKDRNQGICPPTPVCALVEDSSQNIYPCMQVGCTPVAREHPQTDDQSGESLPPISGSKAI